MFFYLSMLQRLHVNYIGFYDVVNGVSDRNMIYTFPIYLVPSRRLRIIFRAFKIQLKLF